MASSTAVADLCDAHFDQVQAGAVRALPPGLLRQFGGASSCAGPVVTLRVFEDNSLVREELEAPGQGRILLVDGAGSTRCALLGGNLVTLAVQNGWGGVLVHGCVRDVAEMLRAPLDIRALGACPIKSVKRGQGQRNVPVVLGGVAVQPGDWCYADLDGVVFSSEQMAWPRM